MYCLRGLRNAMGTCLTQCTFSAALNSVCSQKNHNLIWKTLLYVQWPHCHFNVPAVCDVFPNLPTIFTIIPTLKLNLNKRPIRKVTRNQAIRYVPFCVTFILIASHARKGGGWDLTQELQEEKGGIAIYCA